jgi:hypothetical protein
MLRDAGTLAHVGPVGATVEVLRLLVSPFVGLPTPLQMLRAVTVGGLGDTALGHMGVSTNGTLQNVSTEIEFNFEVHSRAFQPQAAGRFEPGPREEPPYRGVVEGTKK